jgi:hypothetical protein
VLYIKSFNIIILPANLFLRAIPVQEDSENFITGPAPAWVKPCDFDIEALPSEDSDVNYQYLLEDKQIN